MALVKKGERPRKYEPFIGHICFRPMDDGEACGKAVYCRGLCKSHYNMLAVKVKNCVTTWMMSEMEGLCLPAREKKKALAAGEEW